LKGEGIQTRWNNNANLIEAIPIESQESSLEGTNSRLLMQEGLFFVDSLELKLVIVNSLCFCFSIDIIADDRVTTNFSIFAENFKFALHLLEVWQLTLFHRAVDLDQDF